MFKVAICDDEVGTCSDIENAVISCSKKYAIQIETEVFYSGETLYYSIKEDCQFDLVFLDIQLLKMDGVQVGKLIREQLGNENISIVYISSNETYAMSLFQVRPLDFLIKPITKDKIIETLQTFIHLNEIKKKVFCFNRDKSIYRFSFDEIMYFACNKKKIEIHTVTDVIDFYGNMRQVLHQVEGQGFWVIHKSFIVNCNFVAVYHYDSVLMTDDTVLPISQKYRKAMKECLAEIYRDEQNT